MRKVVYFLFFSVVVGLNAYTPLDPPLEIEEAKPSTKITTFWRILAADNALNAGFAQMAENIYRQVLDGSELHPTTLNHVKLNLVSAYIIQAKPEKALQVLNSLPQKKHPGVLLRSAILSFIQGNFEQSEKLASLIHPKDLDADDQSWLLQLQGLLAQENRNFKDAEIYLRRSQELSPSSFQTAKIEALLMRAQIFSGKPTESLAKNLQKKVSQPKNIDDILLHKQYAIVLDSIGRKAEAIEFLENKIKTLSPEQSYHADSLYLLIGILAGENTEYAQNSFQKILRHSSNVSYQKIALPLYVKGKLDNRQTQALAVFIDELMSAPEEHLLMDSLALLRAQIAMLENDTIKAAQYAEFIVNDFPGSAHRKSAQYVLASIAWSSSPPRYRLAADILSQIRSQETNDTKQLFYTLMMADCYFLNGDYQNASSIYSTVLNEKNWDKGVSKGQVLYQLVLSLINENRLQLAEEQLDAFVAISSEDAPMRWRAEWNYINALKVSGSVDKAFSRLHRLRESTYGDYSSPELALRLLWLEAQLSLDAGRPESTPRLTDSIMDVLKSLGPDALDSRQLELIASQTLLLKAQAQIAMHKIDEAVIVLEKLRKAYPDTHAAVLSYIMEARFYASQGRSVDAQQQLIKLSDSHRDSNFAPIALYEAAINAEARELTSTYQEALTILERLSVDYPDSSFVYHARLKQGDILRKLNDFGAAQLVYENLIHAYPDHPLRYRTELDRADCLFAQGAKSKNVSLLKETSDIYERLFDLSSIPADSRAEAGFKAAFTLAKTAKPNRSKEIFWLNISTFLVSPSKSHTLGSEGRYWISRSILELAALQEQEGMSQDAKQTYQLIKQYNLPGEALATAKLK